jgi:integrase
MLVRQRLAEVALDRSLRQSTMLSYERLLNRLGLLDQELDQVSQDSVYEMLWSIDNPNSRRATVIALRSVFGWNMRIPKSMPRRYELPDEVTLRLALMTSPHEARGLLMMYAGLRVGEACAITKSDLDGDRLRVDKQVVQLHRTGSPTITRIAPVKTSEGFVVIPARLEPVVAALDTTAKPDGVRESLRRSGRRVGIALNPHMLRHWYATALLARGIPLAQVSRQMRHSDVTTTLRTYSQFDDGDIRSVFD